MAITCRIKSASLPSIYLEVLFIEYCMKPATNLSTCSSHSVNFVSSSCSFICTTEKLSLGQGEGAQISGGSRELEEVHN